MRARVCKMEIKRVRVRVRERERERLYVCVCGIEQTLYRPHNKAIWLNKRRGWEEGGLKIGNSWIEA